MAGKIENAQTVKVGKVDYKVVYTECRGNEIVPDGEHTHDMCEIYLNLSGDLAFEVEGLVYPIFPGCAIVTAPGERHRCIYRSDALHKHYCVWFSAKGSEGLFPEIFNRPLGERNLYSFTPDSFASLIDRSDRLLRASSGRESACAFYSLIEQLFAEGSCDSASATALPEDVALAVTFINENISSKITVHDIAARAGINITTLERHFASVFRISPLEYIKNKRLDIAEKMIVDGATVTETCYQSGFSDLSKFIILFRQHFGKTPKQYQLDIEKEKKLKKR